MILGEGGVVSNGIVDLPPEFERPLMGGSYLGFEHLIQKIAGLIVAALFGKASAMLCRGFSITLGSS